MCGNCIYKQICKHQDDYNKLRKAIDNVHLNGIDSIIGIKDIPFIESIEIRCKYFRDSKQVLSSDCLVYCGKGINK